MERRERAQASRLAAAAVAVAVAFVLPRAGRAEGLKQAPLAGIVKSGTSPAAGIELLVQGLSAPVASFRRIVRTAADGTWVIPAAPAGLYAVSSLAPGFLPVVARLWHRGDTGDVSFVALNLERPSGVLPPSARGNADPWIARAITAGDVLRERDPAVIETVVAGGPAQAPGSQIVAANARIPLSATVSSTTGFGASNGANLSGTSVDVAGNLGPSVRWGIDGQYRRLGTGDEGGALGNASRVTLDVAPGDQSIRVSARRQTVSPAGDDPAQFAAQGVDWSAATGERSRASVSARLVSESNLLQKGLVADLFARSSNAFEVEARYRTESPDGNFVHFAVGYRAATGVDIPTAALAAFDRETHVGGTAGIQVTRALSFEAGASGDVSNLVRAVAPELTIAVSTPDGIRIYGFASRRFERRLDEELPLARAGTDEAGLSRLSRSLYKAGVRWENADGESLSVEGSQRELLGTYRLLLDPEFFDNLDSLYFLDGDTTREISASGTFRISEGLQGRLSGSVGWLQGDHANAVVHDEARYAVAGFAVRVGVTRTSVSVGYRTVSQKLERSYVLLRNDLEALNLTVAQALPLPALRSLGSEWRALFSLEQGRRMEGEEQARENRRFSGGLALAF